LQGIVANVLLHDCFQLSIAFTRDICRVASIRSSEEIGKHFTDFQPLRIAKAENRGILGPRKAHAARSQFDKVRPGVLDARGLRQAGCGAAMDALVAAVDARRLAREPSERAARARNCWSLEALLAALSVW
jgi:hypothetical protein